MAAPPLALVVGALTRDLEPGPDGREHTRPGGVVLHAGLALQRLGARVRVVTRVRAADADTLAAPLRAAGVDVRALPSRDTTTYRNDYRGDVDRHALLAVSDPIAPDDVPAAWRTADVVQLGPLHPDDLLPETATALAGLRGLDLQGLVRVAGSPLLRPAPALGRFLSAAHVVQASAAELPAAIDGRAPAALMAAHGVREWIVTRGRDGATVTTSAGTVEIAGRPARGTAVVGAGDVFLAVYLLGRLRGRTPAAAATVAAQVTALAIDAGGVPGDACALLHS